MPRHYSRLQCCALTLTIFLLATLGLSALAQQHAAATAPKSAAQHKRSAAPAQPHPSLSYASYLLNPGDRINALAKGVDGSVYAAGVTVPATIVADATQPSAGTGNAFVAHFSADGKKLLYFTYLDHSGLDEARAIAVDANGYAYVTGETKSPAFPVVSAFQASCKTGTSGACAGNAFVAKLDSSGKVVLASYLGGSGEDGGNAIAVGAKGNIYVAGAASSLDFPVTSALQSTPAGKGDAFVAAIAADGSHVLYATYLGGSDADEARGIALDAQGNAYVTGVTLSLDFPTSSALQAKCAANGKSACAGTAFVSKLSADGSRLVYSTYLGGSGGDASNAIAVDKNGSAYVAGLTNSSDFPVAKASQAALAGSSNAFVSKLSADGSALAFSTYLGGKVSDQANAIAVDSNGNVFVAGWTHSPDFPVKNPVQASCRLDGKHACTVDAFAAQLSASGAKLQFSTFLGGSAMDASRGLAVDAQGSVYLGGWTTSRDFPQAQTVQAPGSGKTALAAVSTTAKTAGSSGGSFVAKISGVTAPATTVTCGSGTNNWTGTAADGQWTTASNWSTAAVPVSTDNVCIDSTFSGTTITISNVPAANQTIASLNSGAPIVFQSGPLTITGTSSFYDLNITGDVLTLSGSSTMGTLEDGGGYLTGAGSITVSGLLTWSSGNMCTTYSTTANGCTAPTTQAVTNANGGISFTGYGTLDGRTLNTASGQTVSYTSAYYLYLYDGAVVNNVSGSTWDLGNDGSLISSPPGSAGGVFNNAGTFKKSTGTSTSNVYPAFNNTGTVTLTAATTDFSGGGDCGSACAGTWSVATGATLQLDTGTFALSGGISGAGTVSFASGTENLTGSYNVTGGTTVSGGTVNFNGSVAGVGPLTVSGGLANFTTSSLTTITTPTLTLSGGYLSGPDPITVSGLLTWSSGNMCTTYSTTTNGCTAPTTQAVTNANGGISFTGYGTLDGRTLNTATGKTVSYTSAYYLYLYDGAVVNNVAGSTWDLGNDGSLISSPPGSAGGVFNNAGTFKKSTGTSTSNVYPAFNNTGSVQANAGTTEFEAFAQTAGSTALGGGSITFTNPTTIQAGTFGGSGTVNGAAVTSTGATLAPGTSTTAGAMTIAGGYSQGSGGAMSIKIGGTSSSQFDHVAVSNAVALGGPLSVTLINGFTPAVGTGFTILTSTSTVSGTFSSVSSGWTVTYNPSSVVVTYQGGGGGAPIASLSATKLVFATQIINTTSKPKTVKITNKGTAALNISSIAISGTNAAEYAYKTTTCTSAVNPGAFCTISVTFKPADKGTRTATLTISDNAGTGSQTVALSGVGTYVQITPSPIVFPSQLLNTSSAPMTITVKNVSTVNNVNVSNITMAGTKAAEYTKNGTCTTILPSSTCTLTLTFTPTALGNQAVTLEVFDDGGGSPQKVAVSGKGTYVTLSPSPLTFGSVTVGTSTSQTVTVTNTGPSTAITVKSAAFIGTNKADFKAALGSTCSSVAPNGGTCTITVTFKPAAKGARSATMNVTDTDLGSPQSDPVSGTGQ